MNLKWSTRAMLYQAALIVEIGLLLLMVASGIYFIYRLVRADSYVLDLAKTDNVTLRAIENGTFTIADRATQGACLGVTVVIIMTLVLSLILGFHSNENSFKFILLSCAVYGVLTILMFMLIGVYNNTENGSRINDLQASYVRVWTNYYNKPEFDLSGHFTNYWDALERKHKCCGASKPEDYLASAAAIELPEKCCTYLYNGLSNKCLATDSQKVDACGMVFARADGSFKYLWNALLIALSIWLFIIFLLYLLLTIFSKCCPKMAAAPEKPRQKIPIQMTIFLPIKTPKQRSQDRLSEEGTAGHGKHGYTNQTFDIEPEYLPSVAYQPEIAQPERSVSVGTRPSVSQQQQQQQQVPEQKPVASSKEHEDTSPIIWPFTPRRQKEKDEAPKPKAGKQMTQPEQESEKPAPRRRTLLSFRKSSRKPVEPAEAEPESVNSSSGDEWVSDWETSPGKPFSLFPTASSNFFGTKLNRTPYAQTGPTERNERAAPSPEPVYDFEEDGPTEPEETVPRQSTSDWKQELANEAKEQAREKIPQPPPLPEQQQKKKRFSLSKPFKAPEPMSRRFTQLPDLKETGSIRKSRKEPEIGYDFDFSDSEKRSKK